MSSRHLAVVLATLLTAAPALAAETESHSGTLLAVDLAAHTLKLEEMEPWTGPATRPVTWSVTLTPQTRVDLVRRAREAPAGGWPGGYVDSPLSVEQLRPGEFATVKVARHGRQLSAVSIDVVETPTS